MPNDLSVWSMVLDASPIVQVVVGLLIEHGVITSADLSRLADPVWRSRQEDLWWTAG